MEKAGDLGRCNRLEYLQSPRNHPIRAQAGFSVASVHTASGDGRESQANGGLISGR